MLTVPVRRARGCHSHVHTRRVGARRRRQYLETRRLPVRTRRRSVPTGQRRCLEGVRRGDQLIELAISPLGPAAASAGSLPETGPPLPCAGVAGPIEPVVVTPVDRVQRRVDRRASRRGRRGCRGRCVLAAYVVATRMGGTCTPSSPAGGGVLGVQVPTTAGGARDRRRRRITYLSVRPRRLRCQDGQFGGSGGQRELLIWLRRGRRGRRRLPRPKAHPPFPRASGIPGRWVAPGRWRWDLS
jgi:hypothetical protein